MKKPSVCLFVLTGLFLCIGSPVAAVCGICALVAMIRGY